MKKAFWTTDWFAAVVIVIGVLFAARLGWIDGLDHWAYDLGVRGSAGTPNDRVAVIAIDDESIANIGRWPWPRDVHAELIDVLRKDNAKVIGNTVFFIEPQIDPGLAYIRELSDAFSNSNLVLNRDQLPQHYAAEVDELGAALAEVEVALDTDRRLAASVGDAGNVVLAMPFVLGEPRGNPDQPLPEYVVKHALAAQNVVDEIGAVETGAFPLPTFSAIPPIPGLGPEASAVGSLLVKDDVNARTEPLVVRYFDTYYPSLALLIAARSLNLGAGDIQASLGEGVNLGGLAIRTDDRLRMNTFYYADDGDKPAFSVDSFFDVISGKLRPGRYEDKIVLIGATAAGVGAPQVTPISDAMAPVLTLAHAVSSILNEDFFVLPEWSVWAKLGVVLLIAVYLIGVLPLLKAGMAAGITGALFILIIGTQYGLMTTQAMWVELMLPATLLLIGHLLLTTKRFLVTERGKLKSEAESAESNRTLGLAFQGQGQLDMAFEKFRKCPLDDSMMDLLYNLALDYERKRQFNKAGSVYHYMAEYNPKYRDLDTRMNRMKAMEETVLIGGATTGGPGATMLLDGGGVEKPKLGRYEVEKELGKGAMGIVYLGRDPKINRVVAIKTMALSQEFEADELEEVKARFFREAETAGRLNHPHIVTIYDAGEEHDLAYIAMEFLKGKDLAPYTKKENLLPLPTVIDIVAGAADALDFAHAQNVVHRDIKPANIMYEPDSGEMKITDFGIARITDSSKTKTGMVLGTPSYMSPEQLSGKKVDGHSDLFSLGVMLYQMLTGVLPFQGDSMATLMFKIANEPHPDLLSVRPDLPSCLGEIVDKALAKTVDERYQRGRDMMRELQACGERPAA